jgi:hypothetical protein
MGIGKMPVSAALLVPRDQGNFLVPRDQEIPLVAEFIAHAPLTTGPCATMVRPCGLTNKV